MKSSPNKIILLLLLLCAVFTVHTASAQQKKTRILFVFDASGSMYAKMDNDNRINIAKRTLIKLIDSLRVYPNLEIALRVFGHTSPPNVRDCEDTRLEVPFYKNNYEDMKAKVQGIKPKGTTLIAYSLQQAANDFPKEKNVNNMIILITDGLEECKGDPCAISEAMQRNGVVLKPYIIGFGSTEDFAKAFACVGKYYDANSEQALETILSVVITQVLNATTCQVNLLDIDGKATETNVNMSIYNSATGEMLYNFIHTMNDKGLPDTLVLDPNTTYRFVVHTLPPVEKDNITITPAKHNIIPIETPQGDIQLKVEGVTQYKNLQAVVKKANDLKIIHVQEFNSKKRYLVGKYDLEILSTPRIFIKGVEVSQSKTTTINIPQPGKLDVSMSLDHIAAIYVKNRTSLDWVCDIPQTAGRHTIVLQPGIYKIVARARMANRSLYTFEREFQIRSGEVTTLTLNR